MKSSQFGFLTTTPLTDVVGYDPDITGEVGEGTAVLLMVTNGVMATEEGVEPYLGPTSLWQGYWRIEDDMAVNLRPERTVPLQPLLARIDEERRLGRNYERDKGTVYNPLAEPGEEPPPPPPSPFPSGSPSG